MRAASTVSSHHELCNVAGMIRGCIAACVLVVACHRSDGVPHVGDVVTLPDSEWVITDVRDRGSHISGERDATGLTTQGSYVEVEFVLKNNSGREVSVLHPPNIIDDAGHHLAAIPHQAMYLQSGKALGIEPIAAGSTGTFHTIIELPAKAKAVSVEVYSLSVGEPKSATVSIK